MHNQDAKGVLNFIEFNTTCNPNETTFYEASVQMLK